MTEPNVYAITVGGEWNTVEDPDGTFPDATVTSKRCTCGSSGPWELGTTGHLPVYQCPGCGAIRRPELRHTSKT
jgi:hypothetical protein